MLAAIEPFAFSALKYGLLALLFLFIWRAMRWVVRGLNVDRTRIGCRDRRRARGRLAPPGRAS